jgi:hypothetical protein
MDKKLNLRPQSLMREYGHPSRVHMYQMKKMAAYFVAYLVYGN